MNSLSAASIVNANRHARMQTRPRFSWNLGDLLYVALGLTGWLAVNALVVAGLGVALFLLVGNGTLDGFFIQVSGLASHFIGADPGRRANFAFQLGFVASFTFLIVCFFRRYSLTGLIARNMFEVAS